MYSKITNFFVLYYLNTIYGTMISKEKMGRSGTKFKQSYTDKMVNIYPIFFQYTFSHKKSYMYSKTTNFIVSH